MTSPGFLERTRCVLRGVSNRSCIACRRRTGRGRIKTVKIAARGDEVGGSGTSEESCCLLAWVDSQLDHSKQPPAIPPRKPIHTLHHPLRLRKSPPGRNGYNPLVGPLLLLSLKPPYKYKHNANRDHDYTTSQPHTTISNLTRLHPTGQEYYEGGLSPLDARAHHQIIKSPKSMRRLWHREQLCESTVLTIVL
jgi:hypothetical protein